MKNSTVLSLEEFARRSSSGKNSLERIYQEKTLEQGPIFSLDSIRAAELYCEGFSKRGTSAVCIIVKEKSFFRTWSEISPATEESNSTASVAFGESKEQINSLPVTQEFVTFCQKLLADRIGPIAKAICKKTLAKNPELNRVEFVAALARKIPDPIQAQQFQQLALE